MPKPGLQPVSLIQKRKDTKVCCCSASTWVKIFAPFETLFQLLFVYARLSILLGWNGGWEQAVLDGQVHSTVVRRPMTEKEKKAFEIAVFLFQLIGLSAIIILWIGALKKISACLYVYLVYLGLGTISGFILTGIQMEITLPVLIAKGVELIIIFFVGYFVLLMAGDIELEQRRQLKSVYIEQPPDPDSSLPLALAGQYPGPMDPGYGKQYSHFQQV